MNDTTYANEVFPKGSLKVAPVGKRIIAFGKYAGIAGSYNALIAFGHKYNFFELKRLSHYKDTEDLYKFTNKFKIDASIKIVVIGDGRVAKGAVELLESFNIKKVAVIELNLGHLNMLIRSKFLIDTAFLGRVTGQPIAVTEMIDFINKELETIKEH